MTNLPDAPCPVLVLLSGGRGWPNVWSVRAYQPVKVYYLPPAGNEANTRYVQEFLQTQGLVPEICPPVDAFDKEATRAQCAAIMAANPKTPIIFHVTSAPKMMAFGATEAVWLSKRPDVSALHRDTAGRRNGAAAGHPPEPLSYTPTVDDYLAAYGRTGEEKPAFAPVSREEVAQVRRAAILADHAEYGLHYFFADARVNQEDAKLRIRDMHHFSGRSEYLNALRAAGFLSAFEIRGDEAYLAPTTRGDLFLCHGHWLEGFALEEARKCCDGDASPLFCDCRQSLLIPNHKTKNELDLVCLTYGGLLLYASCKTDRNPFAKGTQTDEHYLDEITARAKLIGGDYCLKMLITTAPRRTAADAFLNKAAEARIELVCGSDLPFLKRKFEEAVQKARTSRPVS